MTVLHRARHIVSISIILIAVLISTVPAQAFSGRAPDPADSSSGALISLYNGRTQFVRKTNATYRVWFPTAAGTLVINNLNFCINPSTNRQDFLQQNDYYDLNGFPGSIPVTNFVVNGITYTGNRYAAANAACDDNRTINLSGLPTDPANSNYHYANINVNFVIRPGFSPANSPSSPYEGIQNGFSLSSPTSGARIGVRDGSSGFSSTQAQVDSTPQYVTYRVPFGTCDMATAYEDKDLSFYDIDNAGGGGAQLGRDVSIALWDYTQGDWVNIGGNGRSWGGATTWILPNNNNALTNRSFRAYKDHKYRLEIRDVYYNNMIQYSIPYSQISYETCPPAPKNATYTTSASVSTPTIDAIAGGSVTFTDQVATSALVGITNETFAYRVTATPGNGGGATWGADATVYPRTVNVGPAPGANKAVVPNRTLTIAPNSNGLIGQQFCRSIEITSTPAGVTNTITAPNLKSACVTIGGNVITAVTNVTGAGPSTTHERGSGDKSMTSGIAAGSIVCDGAIAIGAAIPIDVYRQVNGPALQLVATVNMPNCQVFGGYTSPAQAISGTTLDGIATGTSMQVNTIIRRGATQLSQDPKGILVYEAPFTRFYGSDVSICGTGDANRFVYDNRSGAQPANAAPISAQKGSFVEYYSMYQSGNVPNTTLSGLNSAVFNGFPNGLRTNYPSGNIAGSCGGNIDTASDFTGASITNLANGSTLSGDQAGKRTYYVNGNVTINGNITTSGNKSSAPFDPEQYPVTLIYATGNINITANVSSIEAVLVAGGSINTCSSAATKDRLDEDCRNGLKITGAIAAPTINLQRAIGTRLLADPASTTTVNGGNGTAAEIIEYPWYLSFVTFELADTSNSKFNAYFSLPPRL